MNDQGDTKILGECADKVVLRTRRSVGADRVGGRAVAGNHTELTRIDHLIENGRLGRTRPQEAGQYDDEQQSQERLPISPGTSIMAPAGGEWTLDIARIAHQYLRPNIAAQQ